MPKLTRKNILPNLKSRRSWTNYGRNDELYLSDVYNSNKSNIDEVLSGFGKASPEERFKNLVKEYKEAGYSTVGAVRAVAHSYVHVGFISQREFLAQNMLNGILGDTKARPAFMKALKETGQSLSRLEMSDIFYDRNEKFYIIGGKIKVVLDNSPLAIIIQVIK